MEPLSITSFVEFPNVSKSPRFGLVNIKGENRLRSPNVIRRKRADMTRPIIFLSGRKLGFPGKAIRSYLQSRSRQNKEEVRKREARGRQSEASAVDKPSKTQLGFNQHPS